MTTENIMPRESRFELAVLRTAKVLLFALTLFVSTSGMYCSRMVCSETLPQSPTSKPIANGTVRCIETEPTSLLDAFGGWTDVKGRATGWFHLESFNDRTLLVTPAGHGFVALGVNHLSAVKSHAPDEPDLFRTHYGENWERYALDVLHNFDEWGLNTVDDSVELLRRSRPFFASRDFVATAKYKRPPGEPGAWEFPDVFDPQVVARLERDVEAFCRQHCDDKNLIAYYWTDTPTWDVRKTRVFRQTDWVSEIRKLGPSSPGKQRYVRFVREQYNDDIARFNRAYGLKVASFAEIPGASFDVVDLSRYEVARDDELFLGLIAQQYYGVVGPLVRWLSSNHELGHICQRIDIRR